MKNLSNQTGGCSDKVPCDPLESVISRNAANEPGGVSSGDVPSNCAPEMSSFAASLEPCASSTSVDASTARIVTFEEFNRMSGKNCFELNSSNIPFLCQFFKISNASDDDMMFLLYVRNHGLTRALHVSEVLKWECDKAIGAVLRMLDGSAAT